MTDEPGSHGSQPEKDGEKSPTLRIRLPVEYHLRLHRLKLVTGQQMAEAIRHALDAYLVAEEARLFIPTLLDGAQSGVAEP